MTEAQITQCPKCQTTFRVSPAQLKVAKGAVRCGACLNVFTATDHFQKEDEELSTIDDRTQDLFEDDNDDGNLLISDDEDTMLIDDDNGLLIDDHMDDFIDDDEHETNFANDLNEEFLSLNATKSTDGFFTDSDKVINELEEENEEDESWAEALLNDDDESWAKDLLKEDSEPPKDEPVKVAPAKVQVTPPNMFDLDADLSEAAALADNNAQPFNNTNKFNYIQADPLELHLPDQHARRMRWMWLGLSLAMVLGLVIQTAYFNFEQWSRDPQFRPWYKVACVQVGCDLPPIYDLTQVRTTATPRVSTHPSFQNALSVDILFMNHAAYEQPFPTIRLSFTNKQGNPVAQREFLPVEYLAGEAAGMEMMPSQVPIHIALQIKDPGRSADNYQVSFLQNP